MDTYYFIIYLFTGFFAGFIDSVAGGGGLITVPVLLGTGLPPHLALGTNKFQSSFGSFSASFNFIRKGQVKLSECISGILFTLIGAATGTYLVRQINPEFLSLIIPFLLTGILIYMIAFPKVGRKDNIARLNSHIFFLIFGLALGFYDGFFGPGTGSFWVVSIILFLGHNITKATAFTKVMNFTSNITSLVVYLFGGLVIFEIGAVMAIGQFLGARLGSNMAIKRGALFIRPLFIASVAAMIIKLIYDKF